MNSFEHLVINGDHIKKLNASQLDELVTASDTQVLRMLLSIAAIGNALAVASSNEVAGFGQDVTTELGWTIEAMAQMGSQFSNMAQQAINERDRRRLSPKRE